MNDREGSRMNPKPSNEIYRYLILGLIALDVILVLYSCQRRQVVNPVSNELPTGQIRASMMQGIIPGNGATLMDGGTFDKAGNILVHESSFGWRKPSVLNLTAPDDEKKTGGFHGRAVNLGGVSASNIAVDGDMVYLAACVLDGPGGYGWDVYFFRSEDKGASFDPPQLVSKDWAKGHYGNQGEPGVAVDPVKGNVYIVYTDKSHLRTGLPHNAVFFRRSGDKGKSFSLPAINVGFADNSSDQPSIDASFPGYVRLVYRQIDPEGHSKLVLRSSIDEGEHFYFSNTISAPPLNYETPIILTPSWKDHQDTICLIWRQESPSEPDLQFMASFDGGANYTNPQGISREGKYEYAQSPRADFDSSGNVYCTYMVSSGMSSSDYVFVSRGKYVMLDYQFDVIGPINPIQDQIGDLDIFVSPLNNVYVSWNQADYKHQGAGQDIFVCRNNNKEEFKIFTFLTQPVPNGINREMPRLAGDEHGNIFMAYRDTSKSPGGDILLTIGSDV